MVTVFFAATPPVAAVLIYYIFYISLYSTRRSAFRNAITAVHSIPGLFLGVVGIGLCLLLGSYLWMQDSTDNDSNAVHQDSPWFWTKPWFSACLALWLVVFIGNTLTGFIMIPLLPNCDPSTKREFVTLVCCQCSFLPAILGMLPVPSTWWLPTMQLACYTVCAVGMIVSTANFTLTLWDLCEGKCQNVCSGTYLVDQMDKQHHTMLQKSRHSDTAFFLRLVWHDYCTICFERGSDKTRMPANKLMLFIAFTLVVPFPIIALLGYRLDVLRASYYATAPGLMALPALLEVLMLCTVGNMQVFHGTLAQRGVVTVKSATTWVAATTVLELVVIALVNDQALGGWKGTQEYLYCILSGLCRSAGVE